MDFIEGISFISTKEIRWGSKVGFLIGELNPEKEITGDRIVLNWGDVKFFGTLLSASSIFYKETVPVKDRHLNEVVLAGEIKIKKHIDVINGIINAIGDPTGRLEIANLSSHNWIYDEIEVSTNFIATTNTLKIVIRKQNKTTSYEYYISNLIAVLFFASDNLYVTDGDTIYLNGEKIRLTCIDAPEKTQPYGLEAKEHLMVLLKGKDIEVLRESKDRYGRTLAWLVVEGDTINNTMVKDGFAWWYEYYCKENRTLEKLHNNTKSKKLGLWGGDNPINPYEWRKKH